MAKVGRFIHEALDTSDVSVTTDFNVNNKHDVVTGDPDGRFVGSLDGIILRVKSINQASKITIKVCHTATGQQIVIPDTEAVIALEVGSTVNGGCAYQLNFSYAHTGNDFYIFYKCDAGSCVIDAVDLFWRE